MSFYSVLEVTPTTDVWVSDYLKYGKKILENYGGKYLARTANHERLEGHGENPALRVIIEWPSREAAINFMNDEEYSVHLKGRTEGSISHHFLIEGKDDLA